jgi:hypothetical protein
MEGRSNQWRQWRQADHAAWREPLIFVGISLDNLVGSLATARDNTEPPSAFEIIREHLQ